MQDLQRTQSSKPGDVARTGCLFGGLILGLALGGVLLWFAVLREMQHFWRNDGGYPVELRHLVEAGFYPLALTALAGQFLLGWALLRRARSSARVWIVQMLLLCLCLMLVVAAGAVAFANNVVNLWNGVPLHSHPAEEQPGDR
ncbi:MAG: hypothetical protein JWO82_1740 [Akkermansiaceae bacterium]|nr:hypothetical protein [Akkermansiaceae bacterium]